MKPHTHTIAEDECEHRHNEQGPWAWIRRNLSIPAIIAILGMLGAVFVAISGFTGKVQAGADEAVVVKAIERDYVPKKDMESAIGATHARIGRMESKIDTLTIEILKRLPEK